MCVNFALELLSETIFEISKSLLEVSLDLFGADRDFLAKLLSHLAFNSLDLVVQIGSHLLELQDCRCINLRVMLFKCFGNLTIDLRKNLQCLGALL